MRISDWSSDVCSSDLPNLLYAQAIKGRVSGRGIGIIDMIHMIEVAQGVLVMQHSPAFGKGELKTIKDWFSAYLEWITTHPYGQDEKIGRASCRESVCQYV